MMGIKMTRFLIFTFFFFNYSFASDHNFDVLDYGADPSGKSKSTDAFLKAWAAACDASYHATMNVPKGVYVLGKTVFEGNSCSNTKITVKIDGTLSLARDDYYKIAKGGNWLVFQNVDKVTILGGNLSAHGKYLWNRKKYDKSCPLGATSLMIYNSKDVTIDSLTTSNSQMFHIIVSESQNVNLHNIRIKAHEDSPNTDGIHIAASSHVTISNSNIGTGDDCVSIGPGTANVWIEQVACGPGHGISIGSLGWILQEEGVQNVTVKTAKLTDTQNGVRIKTWANPNTYSYVRNVLFEDIVIDRAFNPILIDQNYCSKGYHCSTDQNSAVKISGITYKDIRGTSASKVAVNFDCSETEPCSGIILEEVKLTYNGQSAAMATCNNADNQISGDVDPTC